MEVWNILIFTNRSVAEVGALALLKWVECDVYNLVQVPGHNLQQGVYYYTVI